MKYSQNNEQNIILDYFKGKYPSTFLDIGAYDGQDLSNTRALMELGWSGVCVEPNEDIYKRLCINTSKFKGVYNIKVAIGKEDGVLEFHSNDTYYSTLSIGDRFKWEGAGMPFTTTKVNCETWSTFISKCVLKKFDFISIDAEGVDLDILLQMNLTELETKLICVEWNGNDFDKYDEYITYFGFKLLHKNAENLIYAL